MTMAKENPEQPVIYEDLQFEEIRQKKSRKPNTCGRWPMVGLAVMVAVVCVGVGFGTAYVIMLRLGEYEDLSVTCMF